MELNFFSILISLMLAVWIMAYMMPRDTEYQQIIKSEVKVKPFHTTGNQRSDFYGNNVYYFTLESPHKELSIEVISEIQINDVKLAKEHDLNLDFGITCARNSRKPCS